MAKRKSDRLFGVHNPLNVHPYDPIMEPHPALQSDWEERGYAMIPVPCDALETVLGALWRLIFSDAWEGEPTDADVIESVGAMHSMIASVPDACIQQGGEQVRLMVDLINDLCELTAHYSDGTTALIVDIKSCIENWVEDNPEKIRDIITEYPPVWDAVDEKDISPYSDDALCGAALRARDYVTTRLNELLLQIGQAGETFESFFEVFPEAKNKLPYEAATRWKYVVTAALDFGATALRNILASDSKQDDLQCAFYCAFKNNSTINRDVIQGAIASLSNHPIWLMLKGLATDVGQVIGGVIDIIYAGSMINLQRLALEAVLGLDEGNNDCAILCSSCPDEIWRIRLPLADSGTHGFFYLWPYDWSFKQFWGDGGLHSGIRKSGAARWVNIFVEYNFQGVELLNMILTYHYNLPNQNADRSREECKVRFTATDAPRIVPCPEGTNTYSANAQDFVTPNDGHISLVGYQTIFPVYPNMSEIILNTVELVGRGTIPVGLIPYKL